MANPRAAFLADEFTLKRGVLDDLDNTAAAEGRDLTDAERADYEAACQRMEVITSEIETINKRTAAFDAQAAAVAATQPTVITRAVDRPIVIPSHAEQLSLMVRAAHGDTAAEDILKRTVDANVLADGISDGGTIQGDLRRFVDNSRPLVAVSNRKPLPSVRAKTFERPFLKTRTNVGEQVTPGDELTSRALEIDSDTVTKKVYGGVVDIPESVADWTDESLIGSIPQDLAEMYGLVTDNVLCDAIEAAVTSNKTVVSLTPTTDAFIKAVIDSASAVYAASKSMPNFIYAAVDRWGEIAGMTDGDGKPLFPVSNPVNSAGSNSAGALSMGTINVLGLPVVVDPQLTAGTWGTAVSKYVETYEQVKGLLDVQAPSTLVTTIAYRGYFATLVEPKAVNGFKTS